MPRSVVTTRHVGLVWLGLGLVLGAVVGMAIALISAPYPGRRLVVVLFQRVDKMKKQGEEQIEQIRPASLTRPRASTAGPGLHHTDLRVRAQLARRDRESAD